MNTLLVLDPLTLPGVIVELLVSEAAGSKGRLLLRVGEDGGVCRISLSSPRLYKKGQTVKVM